jgi:hypothetical protein
VISWMIYNKRLGGLQWPLIKRTIRAATLGLFLVCLCLGCSRSAPGPSVSVPADCQQFLDKYFEAVKSKDVEKIRFFSSYVSPVQSKDMPEASVNMLRQTAGKFAVEGFERMTRELGDFQSYSVLSVKVTTISPADPAANVMAAGIHADIICKAKFSNKQSVQIGLHLFKETQESEYHILAWKYEIGL